MFVLTNAQQLDTTIYNHIDNLLHISACFGHLQGGIRIPTWRWQKKAETCRRFSIWSYSFVSNCCAVLGINTVKLSYCSERG